VDFNFIKIFPASRMVLQEGANEVILGADFLERTQ